MLQIDNIETKYGEIKALKGISLEIDQGEIVCLIGANGAGKSTLLMTISGILKPTSGKIIWEGTEIQGLPPYKIVSAGISQIAEGRRIFSNLTVYENIKLGALLRQDNQGIINQDFEHVITLFPILKERLKKHAGTLSGGERQMLAVARGLMSRPKLILLDEPSLGLAPKLVYKIFDIITQINNEGTSILLVEQNALAALNVSSRGYVLQNGKVVLTGSSMELKNSKEVQQAYLGG